MTSEIKITLLNTLIGELKEELNVQVSQYETAKFNSIDAPTRMESRYDTSGIESAWLADGLSKKIEEKREEILRLESIVSSLEKVSDRVTVGCIVEISKPGTDKKECYFILPVAGGYLVKHDEYEVNTIKFNSPLGKCLINRGKGEKVRADFLAEKELRIVNIF
jgi:hypothetical protein